MNQDNNFNQNNFNTQDNNGMTNNQPLNVQNINRAFNSNVEQNTNINVPTVNSQSTIEPIVSNQQQSTLSYEKPIEQDSIPQYMNNSFENGNASNQSFNNKPSNKKNVGLIIGIVVAVIIVIVIGIIIIVGTNITVNNQGDLNGNQTVNKEKLKIGDYIEYVPDSAEAYTKINSSIASSDNRAISQETLKWQVLRIYDDGSIELIGSQTKSRLFLQGPLGYNNGVFLMNDICANLYSKKSENIVARSINKDDVEYLLTEKGKENRDAYHEFKYKYGETWTFTSEEVMYYPNLYQYEVNAGINTTIPKSDGITPSESYGQYPNGVTTDKIIEMNSGTLTGKETFYALDMRESNFGEGFNILNTNGNGAYWIASRWTNYTSSKISFGLYVINSSYFKGATMAYTNGTYGDMTFNYALRPVVKLDKNVKIKISSGENSESNPHKITMY